MLKNPEKSKPTSDKTSKWNVIKPTRKNLPVWFFVIILFLCFIGLINSWIHPEDHFFLPIIMVFDLILFPFGTSVAQINPIFPTILYNLADGAVLTVYISIISVFIGFFIAIVLAMILVKKESLYGLKTVARFYINFFRSTPLLVQILIIYYGLPALIPSLNPLMRSLNLSIELFAGTTALILNTSAYQAEIIRSGIMAIPSSQIEAARALGLTSRQTMRYVTLPQAIRLIVPPLTNEFINIILNSSLVSAIGVMDLTKISRSLQSYYFLWEILLFAAIYYFVISYSLSKLTKIIEEKYRIPGLGVAHD